MYYFLFPSADSWISSGSSTITGESYRDQNFGQDQILELKKEFFNRSYDHQTRVLISFAGSGFDTFKNLVNDGTIANPKYYLRMYEASGNSDLSAEYTASVQTISQSWDEGVGKFGDNPKTTDGISWENRNYPNGGSAVTWSNADGSQAHGVNTLTTHYATQSFSYESSDIEMDVTDIVSGWINGVNKNYGILLRFSGSQETDSSITGKLKFFSKNTHTIYAPRIEARWDNHNPATGSNTGSLTALDISGNTDNYIYPIALKQKYKETDVPKFRFGARKQFIQKSFSTSVNRVSGSYIPYKSGSYSIVDVASGEAVIPFSGYTSMSCDTKSNYFTEYMNGFYPDRTYKVLIKINYDDGQEIIYDDDFEFKLVR